MPAKYAKSLKYKASNSKEMNKLLEKVNFPKDIKRFSSYQLKVLSEEIRQEIIFAISKIGGHLGASLGTCELIVALHYVFNCPEDKFIFDVGHQAHAHKILTGRKEGIKTLKQKDGLCGFLKRTESEYDVFGAGHSSTSLSVASGLAVARDFNLAKNEVVAIIGDGALSSGMAFEALNNLSTLNSKVIIVLNDNEMSISKAVGGISNHLKTLIDKNSVSSFFESFGFTYYGVLDGHNIDELLVALEKAKNNKQPKPIIVHVKTIKGMGFTQKKASDECYHSIKKFDYLTFENLATSSKESFTDVFAKTLIDIASKNNKVVAITAAMASGTGLNKFESKFPKRFFDVGIAEQHAVTFAGGMCLEGLIPFVCIYSTFLQRAYDQVIHDIAIQSLPIKFIIDRSGLVGEDGETHQGTFDLAFLLPLPSFIIMAPSNEIELEKMLYFSLNITDKPIAIRFPKAEVFSLTAGYSDIDLGKSNVVYKPKKPKIAVIALGTILNSFLSLKEKYDIFLVDARFAKPFDENIVKIALKLCDNLILAEEGSSGGFSSRLLEFIVKENLHTGKNIKTINLPDRFISHQSIAEAKIDAKIDTASIEKIINDMI